MHHSLIIVFRCVQLIRESGTAGRKHVFFRSSLAILILAVPAHAFRAQMAFYEPRPNYYEPRESPVTTPRRQLRVLRPAVNPSRSAGTLLASPSESAFPSLDSTSP